MMKKSLPLLELDTVGILETLVSHGGGNVKVGDKFYRFTVSPIRDKNITRYNRAVLDFFEQFHNEHEYWPTFEEAADALNKSPSTIHFHVSKLRKCGYDVGDTDLTP